MNHCLRIFVFSLLLFRFSDLTAQMGFSMPILSNVQVGDVVDVPVKITNFDSIVAIQFVLRWDPSVLQFQSVGQFNLPDLDESKFGITNALDSGFIRFAWVYFLTQGTTLPDNSAIFHLKLKVVGPINSGTSVVITEIPPLTYFEVVNAHNTAFGISEVSLTTGFVAVGYTYSATRTPVFQPTFSVFPNPFSEKTTISFDLPISANLRLTLTDAVGRPLYETDKKFPAGRNGMEIAYPNMDKKGIYFLIIQSAYFKHAQPLFFAE